MTSANNTHKHTHKVQILEQVRWRLWLDLLWQQFVLTVYNLLIVHLGSTLEETGAEQM